MKLRKKTWVVLLAAFAAGLAFPVFKHLQAKRQLENYRAELRANGEKLVLSEVISHPEATNNGAAHFVAAVKRLPPLPDSELSGALLFVHPGVARVTWACDTLPTETSSDAWPELERIQGACRTQLMDLRTALTSDLFFGAEHDRDYARDNSFAPPHIAQARTAGQWLYGAAIVSLHNGDPQGALEHIRSSLALVNRWRREPLILAATTRCGIGTLAAHATWEALHSDGWTDAQLADLQEAWSATEFLPDLELIVAFERCFRVGQIESHRKWFHGGPSSQSRWSEFLTNVKYCFSDPQRGLGSLMDRYPRYWMWAGWESYAEELQLLQNWQATIETIRISQAEGTSSLLHMENVFQRPLDARHVTPGRRFSRSEARLQRLLGRAAAADASRNLAIAAIALKRWELKNGSYPPSLAALVPDYLSALPVDPMDGAPLRYRLEPDGSYVLYSIGGDENDGQGDPTVIDRGSRNLWAGWREIPSFLSGRDWVWPRAANPAELAAYHGSLADTRAEFEERPARRTRRSEQHELSEFVQLVVAVFGLTPVTQTNRFPANE